MEPKTLVIKIKKYGLTSDDIAKRIGCSKDYVDKLASGSRPNPSYKIMDALRETLKSFESSSAHKSII